jgi:hypothetical protein
MSHREEPAEVDEAAERLRQEQLALVAEILAPDVGLPADSILAPVDSKLPESPPSLHDSVIRGSQGDVLRAVGDFLDNADAGSYTIAIDFEVMKVTWDASPPRVASRLYRENQLDELKVRARELRKHRNSAAPGSNSELLRTLGQHLDRLGVTVRGIDRGADGFRVSGMRGPTFYTGQYLTKDVVVASVRRQQARGEGNPFQRLAMGLPVYARDGARVGTVGEKSETTFKVRRGAFRGDFWLPAECIEGCDADGVTLTVTQAALERHKLRNPKST